MGGIRNSQNCARCRNHGVRNILRGHKKYCTFKNCNCDKCLATKDRQSFIAKEIAMHRNETKNQSETSENVETGLKLNLSLVHSKSMEEKTTSLEEFWNTKNPTKLNKSNGEVRKEQQCSRCRNHGTIQLLRGHKNLCPFANCICSKCEITMKRREIMAKQIKDYRNLKSDDSISSPEILGSPEITTAFRSLNMQQFVDYEPIEDRDLFFMVQSLFEKYTNKTNEAKIQLIYAFTHLARGNWGEIEKALEEGKNMMKDKLVNWKKRRRKSRTM